MDAGKKSVWLMLELSLAARGGLAIPPQGCISRSPPMGGIAQPASCVHSAPMSPAQIAQAIADMAAMDAVLSREDAIALVVSLIGRLEPRSESYEQDLASLLRLGATLQQQAEH